MAKEKKPILPYKISDCITCGRKGVKTSAKRCIDHPYCNQKHRQSERQAKQQKSLKSPKKPISKQSDKRKKLDAVYNVMAAQFKKDRPLCEARLSGCQLKTAHVHHLYSGASRDRFYLDTAEWFPVCNNCHHIIHDVLSKDEAINLGLKKTY